MSYTNKNIHRFQVKRDYKDRFLQKLQLYRRNEKSNNARLVVIAGPNGAGKSAYVKEFFPNDINWDEDLIFNELEAELNKDYFYTEDEISEVLKDIRIKIFDYVVNERLTMVFHTNFSAFFLNKNAFEDYFSNRIHSVIMELFFVDTITLEKSISRVQRRVSEGGHFVSEEDIQQNFDLSIRNIPRHLHLFKSVKIHTNSVDIDSETKEEIDKSTLLQLKNRKPLFDIQNNKCLVKKAAFSDQWMYIRYEKILHFLFERGIEIEVI